MTHRYEYTINEGLNGQRKVSANSYTFADGYFHFLDGDKTKVFSIRADKVSTIQRADATK